MERLELVFIYWNEFEKIWKIEKNAHFFCKRMKKNHVVIDQMDNFFIELVSIQNNTIEAMDSDRITQISNAQNKLKNRVFCRLEF